MFEIFRLQLRAMIGGKRMWLVVLCLALPVLLTFGAVEAGGFGELQQELGAEINASRYAAGQFPPTAHRVVWAGEDREFLGGLVELKQDGIHYRGRPLRTRRVLLIGDGFLVVRDGELWLDPTREGPGRGLRIQFPRRLEADQAPVTGEAPSVEILGAIFLFLLYPQTICLLLALFYGTSVLGEELDGKTLTYLFTRPLPRWRFVVGKYLGIVAALLVPSGVSVLASWWILGAPGGLTLAAASLVGTGGALLAYNALFVLFGFLIPQRAMIVALLYGIFFELMLSFVPALVNEFTITYYLRSLVVAMLDLEIPRDIARMVGGASAAAAVLTLFGIVAGSLGLSSLLASRREYVVKDTA